MQEITKKIFELYEAEKTKAEKEGRKYNLTLFAQEIGITRQALNTLKSQGTYPSYLVLQGIYKKYPHLQLDWYFL